MIAGNTAGVGFAAYVFVILILTKNGVQPNIFIPLTFFYFAALLGICIMFLHYGRPTKESGRSPAEIRDDERAYLRPMTIAQLEETRNVGVGSVTDATTRTLDQVPVAKRES